MHTVCSFGDAPRRVMAEAMLSFGNADDILKAPDRPSVLEHHISDFTKLLKGRGKCSPSHIGRCVLTANLPPRFPPIQ
jgi:hypothetical protein